MRIQIRQSVWFGLFMASFVMLAGAVSTASGQARQRGQTGHPGVGHAPDTGHPGVGRARGQGHPGVSRMRQPRRSRMIDESERARFRQNRKAIRRRFRRNDRDVRRRLTDAPFRHRIRRHHRRRVHHPLIRHDIAYFPLREVYDDHFDDTRWVRPYPPDRWYWRPDTGIYDGGSFYWRRMDRRGRAYDRLDFGPSQRNGQDGQAVQNGKPRSERSPSVGWKYLKDGRYEAARAAFNRRAQLYPYWGQPRVGAAIANGVLDNHRQAVRAMRRALRFDGPAINDVPRADQLSDLFNELTEHYEDIIDRAPGTVDAYFMLSALHYLRGDDSKAAGYIQDAIDYGGGRTSTDMLERLTSQETIQTRSGEQEPTGQ